jgi:hypothetical protein
MLPPTTVENTMSDPLDVLECLLKESGQAANAIWVHLDASAKQHGWRAVQKRLVDVPPFLKERIHAGSFKETLKTTIEDYIVRKATNPDTNARMRMVVQRVMDYKHTNIDNLYNNMHNEVVVDMLRKQALKLASLSEQALDAELEHGCHFRREYTLSNFRNSIRLIMALPDEAARLAVEKTEADAKAKANRVANALLREEAEAKAAAKRRADKAKAAHHICSICFEPFDAKRKQAMFSRCGDSQHECVMCLQCLLGLVGRDTRCVCGRDEIIFKMWEPK